MTREKAIEELKALQTSDDSEKAHSQADTILYDLLTALGFADVVAEFDKVGKWYS